MGGRKVCCLNNELSLEYEKQWLFEGNGMVREKSVSQGIYEIKWNLAELIERQIFLSN